MEPFLSDGSLLALESEIKEAQLKARGTKYLNVLSRLEGLPDFEVAKVNFNRFVNGELTLKELDREIDKHVPKKSE
ncbi:MAG: hypothetical protein FJW36_18710 [Acidobacteria bacterium]|nr:hypothetical protein [Acidobacteriota bacterium]